MKKSIQYGVIKYEFNKDGIGHASIFRHKSPKAPPFLLVYGLGDSIKTTRNDAARLIRANRKAIA